MAHLIIILDAQYAVQVLRDRGVTDTTENLDTPEKRVSSNGAQYRDSVIQDCYL